MRFDSAGRYFPTVFFNEFWLLREHLVPLNESITNLTLSMTLEPIALWKWQFMSQADQSFQMQLSMGSTESEIDEIKVQ
jgi:hypothetical protein